MRGKRGISPLIATVLLIGFTVVLVGLLILWGRSYIEEKAEKEGALAEAKLECENVRYSVVDTSADAALPNSVTITIKNEGSREINGFIFRVQGDSGGPAFEHTTSIPGLSMSDYVIATAQKKDQIGDVTDGTVNILPRLRVASGVYVPCSSKEKEARIIL